MRFLPFSKFSGVEARQLRKVGWTVIGGKPPTTVAHYPQTFRTPAPNFPRHRIRNSDVEPLMVPKSKTDAASLRAAAVSIEHVPTHRRKNPFCPVCHRAKFLKPENLAVCRPYIQQAFGDHARLNTSSLAMPRTADFKMRQ